MAIVPTCDLKQYRNSDPKPHYRRPTMQVRIQEVKKTEIKAIPERRPSWKCKSRDLIGKFLLSFFNFSRRAATVLYSLVKYNCWQSFCTFFDCSIFYHPGAGSTLERMRIRKTDFYLPTTVWKCSLKERQQNAGEKGRKAKNNAASFRCLNFS